MPLITRAKVKLSVRLKTKRPLLTMSLVPNWPVVPPAPMWTSPPLMVVPPL